MAVERLSDLIVRISYEQELFVEIRSSTSSNVGERWDEIKQYSYRFPPI